MVAPPTAPGHSTPYAIAAALPADAQPATPSKPPAASAPRLNASDDSLERRLDRLEQMVQSLLAREKVKKRTDAGHDFHFDLKGPMFDQALEKEMHAKIAAEHAKAAGKLPKFEYEEEELDRIVEKANRDVERAERDAQRDLGGQDAADKLALMAAEIMAARPEEILFVANHANSLIDPVIIGITAKRPVHFLAKAPLFDMLVLGPAMRAVGMIPAFRGVDDPSQVKRNLDSLAAAAVYLVKGEAVGLFPEGKSHDLPKVEQVRSGAARMSVRDSRRCRSGRSRQHTRHLPCHRHGRLPSGPTRSSRSCRSSLPAPPRGP
jgi:1-acyl-sn-glycerol-3-phosphate acyltransferase